MWTRGSTKKVSYPVISPTGAMASGDYVDYMLSYNDELEKYLLYMLTTNYYNTCTINDWSSQWSRQVGDVQSQVTELGTRIANVQAKLTMIQNTI